VNSTTIISRIFRSANILLLQIGFFTACTQVIKFNLTYIPGLRLDTNVVPPSRIIRICVPEIHRVCIYPNEIKCLFYDILTNSHPFIIELENV